MSEQNPTLAQLDPSALIIGTNVRLDPRLDAALVASVRERGVIEPIIAYTDDTGQVVVVVVAGQRRTLAAVRAGRATVPVLLTAEPGEVERIVDQFSENEHRAALVDTERVAALEQLSLIGLSAAQIAKRTATTRATVANALSVATSRSARQALTTHALTLDEAAALAEFEGEPEADDLLNAVERGSHIAFAVQRAREDRGARRSKDAASAAVTASGLTLIDAPGFSNGEKVARLSSLVDAAGQPLTQDDHAGCPGHALYLTRSWMQVDAETGEPIDPEGDEDEGDGDDQQDEGDEDEGDEDGDQQDEGDEDDQQDGGGRSPSNGVRRATCAAAVWTTAGACQDWAAHGHRLRYRSGPGADSRAKKAQDMSQHERDEAKAARALVIRCNRDWSTAQTVRRQWVTTLLTRKTPPKDAGIFLARVLTAHRRTVEGYRTGQSITDLLGLASGELATTLQRASDKRAQVLALGVTLAACEGATDRADWRTTKGSTVLYLTALAAWGYELAEVEQRAAGTYTEPSAPESP